MFVVKSRKKKVLGAFLSDGWSLFFNATNIGFHVVVLQQGTVLMPVCNGIPYVPCTDLNLFDALDDPGE